MRERSARRAAVIVDAARQQRLADAGVAVEQDRNLRVGDLFETRSTSARAVSMVRLSNQLGLLAVEMTMTCGPSTSASRSASAAAMTGEVKYWFSI